MTVPPIRDRQRPLADTRATTEFAEGVHELRSPLATVIGFLETVSARADSLSSDERARMIEVALRNARVLAQRVDDLLDYERVSRPRGQLDLRPVQLLEAIEDVVVDSAGVLGGRTVDVDVDDRTWAEVDREALAHVLGNLLGNAAKFSPEGTVITVRASEGLDDVRVEVVDRGVGIDPDDLPHVFDPFHRGRADTAGSGLGLAVVRHYVHGWRGSLDVDSTPGCGTTVAFTVPATSAPRNG